jgi:hypothetical protein
MKEGLELNSEREILKVRKREKKRNKKELDRKRQRKRQ